MPQGGSKHSPEGPAFTVEQVAEALEESAGVVSAAAKFLGVSRRTVTRYFERWPDLHEIRADIEEENLDRAEMTVHNAIMKGDMTTARWYLARRGKERGYGRTFTIDIPAGDGTATISIDLPTPDDEETWQPPAEFVEIARGIELASGPG